MWRPLPRPDNRLYLGKGGSGKSTLALAHSWEHPRVIVCDPNGEDAHADCAVVTDDPGELIALLMEPGQLRLCWRFAGLGLDAGFDWVNRAAWEAGDVVVVWDEVDLFMRQRMPPAAYRLWNMGRHRNVRVFACSRRPARVPRDCTANLSRAVVFRSQEPNDLKFLSDFMEPDAAQSVAELERFHAVDWTEAEWSEKKSPFP